MKMAENFSRLGFSWAESLILASFSWGWIQEHLSLDYLCTVEAWWIGA